MSITQCGSNSNTNALRMFFSIGFHSIQDYIWHGVARKGRTGWKACRKAAYKAPKGKRCLLTLA